MMDTPANLDIFLAKLLAGEIDDKTAPNIGVDDDGRAQRLNALDAEPDLKQVYLAVCNHLHDSVPSLTKHLYKRICKDGVRVLRGGSR